MNEFFGRDELISDVTACAVAQQAGISIIGARGTGKSRLLQFLASEQSPLLDPKPLRGSAPHNRAFKLPLVLLVDASWRESEAGFGAMVYDHLARRLRREEALALDWNDVEARPHAHARIWRLASQLADAGRWLVLLIDNFDAIDCDTIECAHPAQIDLGNTLRQLTQQATLVVASRQPLYDLPRGESSAALGDLLPPRFMGLLETEAARSWIESTIQASALSSTVRDDLFSWTGRHPFLLHKLADALAEVQRLTSPGAISATQWPALLRLRLAEHGRPLFDACWRSICKPPPHIDGAASLALVEALGAAPLSLDQIRPEQSASLNWLINQAIVRLEPAGCLLFSPLFADYLANQGARPPAPQLAQSPFASHASVQRGPDDPRPLFERLTRIESALLRYFQAHSHRLVTPEQLLADVWQRPNASSRRVQEAIRRLRLQLDEVDPPVGVIENERGRGYRFVPAAPAD